MGLSWRSSWLGVPMQGMRGSTYDQAAKIQHALWPKCQNIKQKQYCNKFNTILKMVHIQKKRKKKKKEKERESMTRERTQMTKSLAWEDQGKNYTKRKAIWCDKLSKSLLSPSSLCLLHDRPMNLRDEGLKQGRHFIQGLCWLRRWQASTSK